MPKKINTWPELGNLTANGNESYSRPSNLYKIGILDLKLLKLKPETLKLELVLTLNPKMLLTHIYMHKYLILII